MATLTIWRRKSFNTAPGAEVRFSPSWPVLFGVLGLTRCICLEPVQ